MTSRRKLILGILSIIVIQLLAGCATSVSHQPLTPEGLFARHLENTYGAKRSLWPMTVTVQGKLIVQDFGIEAPFTIRQKSPDAYSFSADLMGTAISNSCFQGSCWGQEFGQGVRPLTGEQLTFQLQVADFYQFLNMQKYYTQLQIIKSDNGSKPTTYTVQATRANGSRDFYSFSKETGLMVGSIVNAVTAQGNVATTTVNDNFQQFGKVMLPTTVTQSSAQGNIRIEVESVNTDPIADEVFTKPE